MNKKIVILPLLILSLFILTACTSNNYDSKKLGKVQAGEVSPKADKIEVFYFHSTARCTTCLAIGRLTNETVAEYFQPELRDGKIEVREVNIELPENKEIAKKFQASGSSLYLNTIYDNQDHISEDATVWRLSSNPEQFKSYLKNKIEKQLGK